MAGKIIGFIVALGCGIMFYSIGTYAKKLDTPMWFWSGTKVDASKITDVKKYNRANSIMWKLYSLWYFSAGAAQIWSSIAYLIVLLGSCSIGLVILVITYNRIYKKYSVQDNNNE